MCRDKTWIKNACSLVVVDIQGDNGYNHSEPDRNDDWVVEGLNPKHELYRADTYLLRATQKSAIVQGFFPSCS